jgi:hypothetical protein
LPSLREHSKKNLRLVDAASAARMRFWVLWSLYSSSPLRQHSA